MTYTTTDVAKRLGISQRQVRRQCQKWNIGVKSGRDWLLTDADIAAIKAKQK